MVIAWLLYWFVQQTMILKRGNLENLFYNLQNSGDVILFNLGQSHYRYIWHTILEVILNQKPAERAKIPGRLSKFTLRNATSVLEYRTGHLRTSEELTYKPGHLGGNRRNR